MYSVGATVWSAATAARTRALAEQFLEKPPRVCHLLAPFTDGIAVFGLLTILALIRYSDVNSVLSE